MEIFAYYRVDDQSGENLSPDKVSETYSTKEAAYAAMYTAARTEYEEHLKEDPEAKFDDYTEFFCIHQNWAEDADRLTEHYIRYKVLEINLPEIDKVHDAIVICDFYDDADMYATDSGCFPELEKLRETDPEKYKDIIADTANRLDREEITGQMIAEENTAIDFALQAAAADYGIEV